MRYALISVTWVLTMGFGSALAQTPDWSAVNSRVDAFYTAMAQRNMEGVANSLHPDAVVALTTE